MVLLLSACITYEEDKFLLDYSIAKSALVAARLNYASKRSPGLYQQAIQHFDLGEKYFQSGKYSKATREFKLSRKFSERAENESRIIDKGD